MKVEEPDYTYGHYTYADYLKWQFDEQVELIKGKIYKMGLAPKMIHQKVSWILTREIGNYIKNKKCMAFSAPFDVRLPVKSKNNKEISTVVQPDLCVICDLSKLDEAGCIGAPDIVIEILSKGNNTKELKYKYEVYEESGVKEYWVIYPEEQSLLIYTLIDEKYQPSRLLTRGDTITTTVLPGFVLELDDVFEKEE